MFLLIFLSLLFTGNRERRKCYFVQVLNPRPCQGKGKLLLATYEQRVAYRLGKLSNAEISDFSASRRVSRVEPPISSTFDKLGEGSAGEGTLARW